jgi:hypothetical protein
MPRTRWRFAAGTRNFVRFLLVLNIRARFAGPPPRVVEAVSKSESVDQTHRAVQFSESAVLKGLPNLVDYTEALGPSSSFLTVRRSLTL